MTYFAAALLALQLALQTPLDAPQEDDPGWSCVDDGNRICGPGNANGVPAGRYDEGGVLVETWQDMHP